MSNAATSSQQRHWQRSLEQALDHTDDSGLWNFLQVHEDDTAVQDAVAQYLSRAQFQHGARTVYSQIYCMPVVTQCGNLPSGDDWTHVSATVSTALHQWFPRSVGLVLFPGVTPFSWMTSWTPRILRAHLHRLQPQKRDVNSRVAFSAQAIALPPEAPQLGFIVIGCSTHTQWPQGSQDAMKSVRLEAVVRHALQLAHGLEGWALQDACGVSAPSPMHEAIPAGVVQWLKTLHRHVGIDRFSVNPSSQDPDVLDITLQLRHETASHTSFPLRRHQMGHRGISAVLARLYDIAPRHADSGLPH